MPAYFKIIDYCGIERRIASMDFDMPNTRIDTKKEQLKGGRCKLTNREREVYLLAKSGDLYPTKNPWVPGGWTINSKTELNSKGKPKNVLKIIRQLAGKGWLKFAITPAGPKLCTPEVYEFMRADWFEPTNKPFNGTVTGRQAGKSAMLAMGYGMGYEKLKGIK